MSETSTDDQLDVFDDAEPVETSPVAAPLIGWTVALVVFATAAGAVLVVVGAALAGPFVAFWSRVLGIGA